MKEKDYIPGFDWIKLIGSVLIAHYHICGLGFFGDLLPVQFNAVFSETVPLFFMISGYLMHRALVRKKQPVRHLIHYIMKYGVIYFVMCFLGNSIVYIKVLLQTGEFLWKSLLVDTVLSPLQMPYIAPLWFLPPLLIGIYINSLLFLHHKERSGGKYIFIYTSFVIVCNIYGGNIAHWPMIDRIVSWKYFGYISFFFSRAARGLVYVYIGMYTSLYRDRCTKQAAWKLLLLGILLAALEIPLMMQYGSDNFGTLAFNFSTIILGVVMLMLILRMKGHFLAPYHKHISLFSVLTFLLHSLQAHSLKDCVPNSLVRFFAVIAMNALLTILIICYQKTHTRETSNGL